ncbi:monooxygenase [Arenibacter sp. 6A1]|uniref:monooxygenase n=1 Tax=Arenibacter sp. 6A1 TaxID=2720391 RepID=UPI001444D9DD|nr:monooxygenase [Arenibacter sp. 6A1]NKI27553.1 monooxygenase [Arenibacter sp. 6A1]
MAVIMYVDFPHNGPFGDELKNQLSELAESINHEPGLIWKVWTENQEEKTAGGVYLFDTRENATKYLAMHSARLTDFGYTNIKGKIS